MWWSICRKPPSTIDTCFSPHDVEVSTQLVNYVTIVGGVLRHVAFLGHGQSEPRCGTTHQFWWPKLRSLKELVLKFHIISHLASISSICHSCACSCTYIYIFIPCTFFIDIDIPFAPCFFSHTWRRNNELFAGGFDVRDMTFRHGGLDRAANHGHGHFMLLWHR